MKRIKDKRKTEKLRKEAMGELRKTRAHFEKEHPALLEAMRKLVAKVGKVEEEQATPEETAKPVDTDEMVVIDRQKNLEAVLKYAALNPGTSGKLKKQLKELLN